MALEALVRDTIRLARIEADAARTEADLFAKMGMIGPEAPLHVGLVGKSAKVDRKKLEKKGRKLFESVKGELEGLACDDLDYCERKDDVGNFLDKNLPKIVSLLLKKQKKLPKVISGVLGLLGIGATSWNVVVVFVTAWLIKKGLDDLCKCRV